MGFNLFSVSLRNLKRKSFRTAILILSLGLLVSTLVFGLSFIMSVSSTVTRASDRLGADLLIVPVGARDSAQEVLLETKIKQFYMPREIIERVRKVEGIEALTYHTYISSILGVCCDVPEAKIVAFDQDSDFILRPWLKKSLGRRLEKGEAILGWAAAENLVLLEVDSSVLFNMKFDFVGTLDRTGTGLDDAIFILNDNIPDMAKVARLEAGAGDISLIFASLKPGFTSKDVGGDVETEIVEVDVIKRNEMGGKIIRVLGDINKLFLIIVALASLISTSLAWSVFSAIANERMREIGIMKALGARRSHVIRIFMSEVLVVGTLGSLAGILGGTMLSIGLGRSFEILREISATLTLDERVLVGFVGLLAGVGICLAGAYSSILRIRRLEPLSAIKDI